MIGGPLEPARQERRAFDPDAARDGVKTAAERRGAPQVSGAFSYDPVGAERAHGLYRATLDMVSQADGSPRSWAPPRRAA
jgi:hypothetical protein